MESLSNIMACLSHFKENQAIMTILTSVLELGNLTNYIYSRNDAVRAAGLRKAVGFRASSLLKLKDYKGNDDKSTLLGFLKKILTAKFPSALSSFNKDFISLLNSGRFFDVQSTRSTVKDLNQEFHSLSNIPRDADKGNTQKFHQIMKSSLDNIKDQISELNSKIQEFDSAWNDVCIFYGEDPKELTAEEFIRIWHTFVQQLQLDS